ncbi:hypothetical protein OIU84_024988 [Salix udensis]|uniref:Uncharacterized protein n=1 Tax=Salix udensis TaxID=889485 RepID=A0AAD6KIH1_9ROSI|nr:hypothetical protein OIU84_024988 [Salix udensis]
MLMQNRPNQAKKIGKVREIRRKREKKLMYKNKMKADNNNKKKKKWPSPRVFLIDLSPPQKKGILQSFDMYVNTYCDDQDGDYAKVYNSMNKNGDPTGVHVPKLYHSCSCW